MARGYPFQEVSIDEHPVENLIFKLLTGGKELKPPKDARLKYKLVRAQLRRPETRSLFHLSLNNINIRNYGIQHSGGFSETLHYYKRLDHIYVQDRRFGRKNNATPDNPSALFFRYEVRPR